MSEENEKTHSNNDDDLDEEEFDISVYASDKAIFNQIQEIKRIKDPVTISSMQIRLSKLSNLKGINLFTGLIRLDISNNQISSLKNSLYYLQKLTTLNVSCNKLTSLDGIEDLECLVDLNVSHNKISSLETFSRFITKRKLRTLNIKGNLIFELKQFDYLTGFTELTTLILSEGNDTNPVCQNANCNEYIEGVLSTVENVNNNINAKTTNNVSIVQPLNLSRINNTRQMFSTGNNNQFNINKQQDMIREQKNAMYKYEQEKSKLNYKISSLEDDVVHLNDENKALRAKIDSLETNLKEMKYKNADLYQQNSSLTTSLHEKENEISDITIKLAKIKKDYEVSLIENQKLISINKDNKNEIASLKESMCDLKSQIEKNENTYKDIINKKNDEINERIRSMSLTESKLYDISKSVTDKQNEIAKLIDVNTNLQQTVTRLNKEKSELEFDCSKKIDSELTQAKEKYKAAIEENERKYTSMINAKAEETLNDIKAIEKHYETLLSEANEKNATLLKENNNLKFSLSECKSLLKDTIDKDDSNTKEILQIKEENKKLNDELASLTSSDKSLKLELKDINALNAKLNDKINELNTEKENLNKEITAMNKEINSLHDELNEKENVINDMLAQIKELKNQPDIEELNEIIKTKTMLSDDQANQIIELNHRIDDMNKENEKISSKLSSYKKKIESLSKQIEEKDNRNSEYETKLAQNENDIAEYEKQIKDKEELLELIQKELNDIREIIDKDKLSIEEKNKEISKLNEIIDEFKTLIITQKEQNKDLISQFDKYKEECEKEKTFYKTQNNEMKNELKFVISEYEKIQSQCEKYQTKFIQFNQMMSGFN